MLIVPFLPFLTSKPLHALSPSDLPPLQVPPLRPKLFTSESASSRTPCTWDVPLHLRRHFDPRPFTFARSPSPPAEFLHLRLHLGPKLVQTMTLFPLFFRRNSSSSPKKRRRRRRSKGGKSVRCQSSLSSSSDDEDEERGRENCEDKDCDDNNNADCAGDDDSCGGNGSGGSNRGKVGGAKTLLVASCVASRTRSRMGRQKRFCYTAYFNDVEEEEVKDEEKEAEMGLLSSNEEDEKGRTKGNAMNDNKKEGGVRQNFCDEQLPLVFSLGDEEAVQVGKSEEEKMLDILWADFELAMEVKEEEEEKEAEITLIRS